MKKLTNKLFKVLKQNNLFVKIFIVTVVSIISVTLLITFSTMRMSATLFVDTFTITNTKVLNQIKSRFESFSYAVINASNRLQNSGAIKKVLSEEELKTIEVATLYYDINKQMESIYSNLHPYDTNIIVLGENELLFNMNYYNWPITWAELSDHSITDNTINNPKKLIYQLDPPTNLNKEARIIASKTLREFSTDKVYGVMYFSIREKDFKNFYEDYTSVGNDVIILDREGKVISSNQEDMIGIQNLDLLNFATEVEEQQIKYKDVNILGENYILMSEFLPTFNMYLINLVDKNIMMNNLINRKEVIFISISAVLVTVIILFIITKRMTRSLSRLVNEISNMAKYNFSKQVSVANGYEAGKIADAFNFMLNELQEYVDIVIQTQKRQRDAELRALQHQINPHFLYNTLTSVKFIVQQGQTEKATDMIHALISLLQSALGNIDQTITVKQELKNTKNYVFINQARYGDKIKVNYFVSPDCLDYYIPKLVIQPFIENAFFHAFNKKSKGYIQVLVAKRAEKLVCEIIDNGDGMELKHNNLAKEKHHLFSGIGIKNVQERIQLLYGNDYGVEISSKLTEGTKIKIDFPLLGQKTELYKNITSM